MVVQHRFACGVFLRDAALCLLGLSDAALEVLAMSFPRATIRHLRSWRAS